MKMITLTQGKYAKVDDADFDALNQHNWQATFQGGRWYAVRQETRRGKRRNIRLHRAVIDVPPFVPVAFEDGDSLNCQRANLSLSRKRRPARSQHPATDQPAHVPAATTMPNEIVTRPTLWTDRIRALFRPLRP